jgi:hypothetical protein
LEFREKKIVRREGKKNSEKISTGQKGIPAAGALDIFFPNATL